MSKSENKARISVRKLDNDNIVLHDDKSEYSKEFQVKIQRFYLIIFTKNNRCYSKFMDGEKTIRKLLTKPKYLNLKFIIAICPKKYSITQKLISLSNDKLKNKRLNMIKTWNHVQCLKNFLKYHELSIEDIRYHYWKLELMSELNTKSTIYNKEILYNILKSEINKITQTNIEKIYETIILNYNYREIQIMVYNPDRSSFIELVKNMDRCLFVEQLIKFLYIFFILLVIVIIIINVY